MGPPPDRLRPGPTRLLPLLLALLCAGPPARAEAPRGSFEGRLGALVPRQVLDGPGLRLRAGWRHALGAAFWMHVEGGADRTTVSNLSGDLAAPGGGVTVRADQTQWTLPLLVGLGWERPTDLAWGVFLGAGGAWVHAELESSVVGHPARRATSDGWLAPVVTARVDASYRAGRGRLVAGLGWQEVPWGDAARRTGDVRAAGLVLEGGWRAEY